MADEQNYAHNSPQKTRFINKFSPKRRIGIILSFFSLLLLGIMPIISNSRPVALTALNFALYLSLWELICSLPLFIYELRKANSGIFQRAINSNIRKKTLFIMGFTGIIFSFSTFLYVYAFEIVGTISAAIAIQTYPLFSIIMEFIFFKKKKRVLELILTLTLIVGIYYLGTKGSWLISDFSPWFIIALSVPILWSIAHVIIKHTLDESPITPNQVTFFRVLISTLILLLISSFLNGFSLIFTGLMNSEFQIFGFLMGLVYYLELVNWFYAVKHVEVSVASTITTPTPIITMIFAFFFLNESILPYQIIAMIVVFVSLYGLIWAGKDKN